MASVVGTFRVVQLQTMSVFFGMSLGSVSALTPWVGKGMDLKTENVFFKRGQKLQVQITIEFKEYFMSTTSA